MVRDVSEHSSVWKENNQENNHCALLVKTVEESEAEVLNGLKTLCKDEETNEEAAETMRQGLPKLWDVAPEIARTVERPFQFEEFEEAAKRCGRRRTPGEDGIPSEVWLTQRFLVDSSV